MMGKITETKLRYKKLEVPNLSSSLLNFQATKLIWRNHTQFELMCTKILPPIINGKESSLPENRGSPHINKREWLPYFKLRLPPVKMTLSAAPRNKAK